MKNDDMDEFVMVSYQELLTQLFGHSTVNDVKAPESLFQDLDVIMEAE